MHLLRHACIQTLTGSWLMRPQRRIDDWFSALKQKVCKGHARVMTKLCVSVCLHACFCLCPSVFASVQQLGFGWCRFLRVIIVSSFREEARGQKKVVGIHHDMARLFGELSQTLRGAPSNALLAGLLRQAAPHQMKVNVWARLRGQQAQLTIQVSSSVIVTCVHLPM